MLLRINEQLSIENLTNHPAEIVEQLDELLTSGVEARLDPNRKNFYEVENAGQIFYIHASPANGRVMLLAAWPAGLRVPALALADLP
jgi:hypothetical protein